MNTKMTGLSLAAVLTAAMLAGCGGSSSSSSSSGGYCDDVKAAKASFLGVTSNAITQEKFDQFVIALHTIKNEAPSDVRGAWTTFSDSVDTFGAALSKTGMTMDDLAKMQTSTHMASGPRMDRIMAAAQPLGTIAFANATAAIETEAQKQCGVDLNPA